MKEIKQIVDAFDAAEQRGQQTALATVVHVEGSSYRQPGARMLIADDGALTGAISGGCLEGDALRKALMAMMEGKPLLVTYDTSNEDDAIIGIGLGCNGIIRVLIEPIDSGNPANPIMLLKQALRQRQRSVLITLFSLENKWDGLQGTRWLVEEKNGIPIGDDIDTHLALHTDTLLGHVGRVFGNQQSKFINMGGVAKTVAFIEYLVPNISLLIAGAGNDVLPLVQMANVLGWEVILTDGRPSYANESRFPNCQIIVSEPTLALDGVTLDSRTACVLMTHNYSYDKAMLRQLYHAPVSYIGILGPKRKYQRMRDELAGEGMSMSDKQLSRIHSPTGLDIGAETPAEIALAIIAEINAVFAGKNGGPLKNLPSSIHHRQALEVHTG